MAPCTPLPGAPKFWNPLRDNEYFQVGIATGGWGHTARMQLESAGLLYAGAAVASSDDAHARVKIMERSRRTAFANRLNYLFWRRRMNQLAAERLGGGLIGLGIRLRDTCAKGCRTSLAPTYRRRLPNSLRRVRDDQRDERDLANTNVHFCNRAADVIQV